MRAGLKELRGAFRAGEARLGDMAVKTARLREDLLDTAERAPYAPPSKRQAAVG